MIKKLFFSIFFILILFSGILSFMLCTETGARFAVFFIKKSVPGQLSMSVSKGALIGPIELQSISYKNRDISFSASLLQLDIAVRDLFKMKLHVLQCKVNDLNLNIFSGSARDESSKKRGNMSIPLEILMDKGELSGFSICLDSNRSCVKGENLSLMASIKNKEWKIRSQLKGFHLIDENRELMNGELSLNLDGLPKKYAASLEGEIISYIHPDKSHIRISGHGSTHDFKADQVSLISPFGIIDGHGSISWKEKFSIDASVNAKKIDTSVLYPELKGSLDFEGNISFSSQSDTGKWSLSTKGFKGKMDDYPFDLALQVKGEQGLFHIAQLAVHSGDSYIKAKGEAGRRNDLEWKVDIKDLAGFVPSGKGIIAGHGKLKGAIDDLRITGNLKGEKIKVSNYRADSILMDLDLFLADRKKSHLDIKTSQLTLDNLEFDSLNLNGSGTLSSHILSFSIASGTTIFFLDAKGSYDSSSWKGVISKTEFFEDHLGQWSLKKPSSLQIFRENVRLERTCFKADEASLCLDGTWSKDRGWAVNSVASQFPLERLKFNEMEGVKWKGLMDGSLYISGQGDTIKMALANLSSKESIFTYTPVAGQLQTVNIKNWRADGELKDKAFSGKLRLNIPQKNYASLFIHISPLDLKASPDTWEISQGEIDAHLDNLTLLGSLVPEIANPKGIIRANISLGGMITRPIFSGFLTLEEGSFFVPDLGARLRDVSFTVLSEKNKELSLNGTAKSGKGHLELKGKIDISDGNLASKIKITGKDVETARLPWLFVTASPDLELSLDENLMKLSGNINIPEARITPADLSGAILPSHDVIMMKGEERIEPEKKEKFRLASKISLIMGEKVYFKSFGVEGKLKGTLSIEDEPGRPMGGTGEINLIDGFYRAYGTNLSIEHGKLIFVGGPLDNPGIEARVVKKTENVLSGLKLSGQLKQPNVTLFSDPPMPQPEVLSYLMFGKPLQKLSKDNGKELYGFASSLLLKKGDGNLLGKDIASRLGLEEIKISSDNGIQESSIFISKYLSPSLYIRYGIGLFSPETSIKLLYHINKNWRLETEAGSSFSGSDLIYSIEK